MARLLQRAVSPVAPGVAGRLTPDRVAAGLERYYATFDAVAGDRAAVLRAFALSQVGWLLFAVPLYTGGLAVGVALPPALVLFAVPPAGVATAFPLPGGLGGFEVALSAVLVALVGVDLAVAGAVVLLYRLCAYWFLVLVGGVASVYGATSARRLAAEAGRLD